MCNNPDDLRCQDGIVMELLKTASYELLHGRGIIGFSLPVRMFEPRSTLERIADWWCTGPVFLPKAADAVDVVERVKWVTAFVVGGLYTSAPQRKPFNPILGETFEGFWPDGTNIFMEHISHHPAISYFYVLYQL